MPTENEQVPNCHGQFSSVDSANHEWRHHQMLSWENVNQFRFRFPIADNSFLKVEYVEQIRLTGFEYQLGHLVRLKNNMFDFIYDNV